MHMRIRAALARMRKRDDALYVIAWKHNGTGTEGRGGRTHGMPHDDAVRRMEALRAHERLMPVRAVSYWIERV